MNPSTEIGDYYRPQLVQRKFHESRARYPLLEGGRGGGKSTALLWEAITQCILIPGCNCLLLRRTLTSMEKGGIEDLFTKSVPAHLYYRYNASRKVDLLERVEIVLWACQKRRGPPAVSRRGVCLYRLGRVDAVHVPPVGFSEGLESLPHQELLAPRERVQGQAADGGRHESEWHWIWLGESFMDSEEAGGGDGGEL